MPVSVTPILVAEVLAVDEHIPVYVHLVEHPDARILVDTGIKELHPAVEDMDPRLHAWDPGDVDIVVNTHLHYDHCGGNHRFAGKPFYVQRSELETARAGGYTLEDWVDAPGVEYTTVDGEHELLPGVRLLPAPGHCDGMQVVVIEAGGRPVVIGGDVAVWHGEFDEEPTEGRRRVLDLDPELVWLSHTHEPWRPRREP